MTSIVIVGGGHAAAQLCSSLVEAGLQRDTGLGFSTFQFHKWSKSVTSSKRSAKTAPFCSPRIFFRKVEVIDQGAADDDVGVLVGAQRISIEVSYLRTRAHDHEE